MDKETRPYAGFFARASAFAAEHVILVMIPGLIFFTYIPDLFQTVMNLIRDIPFWLYPTIYHSYILSLNYFLLRRYETTVGKSLFRLKIRSVDNKKMTIGQIVLREIVSKQISAFICYMGYLPAAFRKDKRAVHDVLAKTMVIAEINRSVPSVTHKQPSIVSFVVQCLVLTIALKVSYDIKDKLFGNFKRQALSQIDNETLNQFKEERKKKSKEREPKKAEPAPLPVIAPAMSPPTDVVPPPPAYQPVVHEKQYYLQHHRTLTGFQAEELNSESFQKAMMADNPFLVTILPENVTLKKEIAEKAAEDFYKFIEFLPDHLKNDPEIQAIHKKNEENYKTNFYKFVTNNVGTIDTNNKRLVHPDFYRDQIFAQSALRQCLLSLSNFNYLKRMEFPQESMATIRFVLQNETMNPTCVPEPILKDTDFMLKMSHNNFYLDKIIEINKDPRLLELKVKKMFEEKYHSLIPAIGKTSLEVQNLASFQREVFSHYYMTLKHLHPDISYHDDVLEEFIKSHYKPERFFSEFQRSHPKIKLLLAKHPNNSESYLAGYRLFMVEKLLSKELSDRGDSRSYQIQNLPEELLSDDNFHIAMLNDLHIGRYYLESATKLKPLGEKTKNYILEECEKSGRFRMLIFGSIPNFLRTDEKFLEAFKKACEGGKKPVEMQVI